MYKCYFCNGNLKWSQARGACENHKDIVYHFYNFNSNIIDYVSFNTFNSNNEFAVFISLEEKRVHFEGRHFKFQVSISLNNLDLINQENIYSILNKIMENKAFI